MIYLELFWSFFQIGLFSIGGGYAAMPLIQEQVVELHSWLTLTQFTDVITISEMTPGPIAINSATFVGMQVAGTAGALAATVGNVMPSCIIVLTLAFLYKRFKNLSVIQGILSGLRPAVIAMIASAGITIFLSAVFKDISLPFEFSNINIVSVLIFIGAFLVLRIKKVNPIFIMLACAITGGVAFSLLSYFGISI